MKGIEAGVSRAGSKPQGAGHCDTHDSNAPTSGNRRIISIKKYLHETPANGLFPSVVLGLCLALAAVLATPAHAAMQMERINVVDKRRPQPILTFDRSQIERSGEVFLADFLQNLPGTGGAENSLFNYGGSGASYLDLRNLGPGRSRILVDGLPFVGNDHGAVDLTSLPIAAVERIEIYYGTEALRWDPDGSAGVVNIVLVRDYSGWQIDFAQGQFQHGDGLSQRASLTTGANLGSGHWGLIVNHEEQDEVIAAARALSAETVFGAEQISRGSSPNGSFIIRGLPPSFITLIPGRNGCAADTPCAVAATEDFDFAPSHPFPQAQEREYLLTPTDRQFVYGWHSIEWNGVGLESSLFWNRRSSAQQFVPAVLSLSGAVNVSADSLYNPFGADTVVGSFQPIDNGNRRNEQQVDTHRIAARAFGSSDQWTWNFDLVASGFQSQGTRLNLIDYNALGLALGPSFLAADGRPRCGSPDQVIENCHPVNVFGGAAGFTPAMAAGIRFDEHTLGKSQLIAMQLRLSREVNLWNRSAQSELRFLQRFSELHLPAAAGGTDQTSTKVDGVEWLLDFPILPRSGPQSASIDSQVNTGVLQGASFGPKLVGGFSVNYAPRSGPQLTLEWAGQLRTPTSAELESATVTGVEVLGEDPCGRFFLPVAVQERCTGGISGLAPVFPGSRTSGSAAAQFGGNPDLQPERAKLSSLTLSWVPELFPEWSMELVGYRGRITQPIALPSGRQLIAECYFEGQLWACARVSRGANGRPAFDLRPINLPYPVKYSGVDAKLSMQRPFSQGVLSLAVAASYLDEYRTRSIQELGELSISAFSSGSRRNSLIPPNYSNLSGTYFDRNPFYRLRGNLELGWQQQDYSIQLIGRWFSGLRESCDLLLQSAISRGDPIIGAPCSEPGPSGISRLGENRIGPRLVTDARFTWQPSTRWSLTLGVRNIFNRDPDNSFSTIANSFDPMQGVPGRHIYFAFTIK
jgi:iron complex outermembrane receptor protein